MWFVAAAGAPRDLGEEGRLLDRAFREEDVGGRIFQQHLPAEDLLDRVDMVGDAVQGLLRIGQGQEVVEEDAVVRRPGEMLGKAVWLVAVAERPQPGEVGAVERLHRADRQADPVNGQGKILPQPAELGMRRAAGANVVLGVNLEEADGLRFGDDVGEVLGLETGAGAPGQG